MYRCAETDATGRQCREFPYSASEYCWAHLVVNGLLGVKKKRHILYSIFLLFFAITFAIEFLQSCWKAATQPDASAFTGIYYCFSFSGWMFSFALMAFRRLDTTWPKLWAVFTGMIVFFYGMGAIFTIILPNSRQLIASVTQLNLPDPLSATFILMALAIFFALMFLNRVLFMPLGKRTYILIMALYLLAYLLSALFDTAPFIPLICLVLVLGYVLDGITGWYGKVREWINARRL